ncbi:MAG: homoserine O-acetyltransferase [Betaproteobacteria bacterium]|nr:MAG: homoserine O-acetyltransferase [Betaproteobacteria bacterium]
MTQRARNEFFVALCLAIVTSFATPALAYDGTVKKEVFTMPSYTAVNGKTIKNVRIGYESYGTLSAAKDNVILICHFFSGTSHAAGKYKPEDAAPGYWDAIIGSGKAIDTDKYFVISSDNLVNLNAKDPNVTTTGPATVNPDTGKAYGLTFPIVSLRDFVNVQKALLDSLGIKKLAAVAGASGGGILAVEWSAAYPDMVERVISAIAPGLEIDAYGVEMLNMWNTPITMDPKWNNGDYYGRDEPMEGVAQSLKLVILSSSGYGGVEKRFGRKWAAEDKDPGAAIGNLYAIEDGLYKAAAARAKAVDANHFLYTSRANQLFSVAAEAKKIKAKFLFVPAKSDLVFPPWMARRSADVLRAQGNSVEIFEIDGDSGHYDGLFQISQASTAIRNLLAR